MKPLPPTPALLSCASAPREGAREGILFGAAADYGPTYGVRAAWTPEN